MGVSTDAHLCFGYDLGDDDGSDDFDRLRELDDEKYSELTAAEKKHGVEIVRHCSDEAVMRIICDAKTALRAWRGEPKRFTSLDKPKDAKTRIRAFCEELGLKVPDGEPAWLLASSWG